MTEQIAGGVPGGMPGGTTGGPAGGAAGSVPAELADTPVAAIRVVTGSPTEVELAAAHSVIVAVLAEQSVRGAELLDHPVDLWKMSTRTMRSPLAPGAGAWRAAGTLR